MRVESDNASALAELYRTMKTDSEKQKFDVALFKRINRDSDYRPISYLPLLAMFQLGRLREYLQHVKTQLSGADGYSFDEVTRLLGGLLRIQHTKFSDEDLDAAEMFVGDLPGHAYYVREKVAAVRVSRLAKPASNP
jgi:hypothetical protein